MSFRLPTCLWPVTRSRWTGLASLLALVLPWVIQSSCIGDNTAYCPEDSDRPECRRTIDTPDLAMDDPRVDLSRPPSDLAGADLSSPLDAAGSPIDIDKPGPYKTAVLEVPISVTGGTTRTTIIGPSDDGATLTLRDAPFPVVVLSPGFTLATSYFTNYGQRLASYGLIAVLQKVPNEVNHTTYRTNTVELLDWLEKPTGPDSSRVKGRLDPDKLGLVGHSLGGMISLHVAAADPRVKAVFGLDPVDSESLPVKGLLTRIKLPSGVPIAYVGETISKGGLMPCAPAARNYEVLFASSPAPAFAITVIGAAHNDFIDLCGLACAICPGGTAMKERTNRLAIRYVTAYFLRHLRGDVRAETYLSGGELGKDIAAGFITRTSK